VDQLASNVQKGRLLPLGYGINVNLPILNQTCSNPPFVQSRLTGGAIVDKAVFNATSGLFTYGNDVNQGINACINGDCSLPGETNVITTCSVAVSVFTTDYDAPNCGGSANVRTLFEPLVAFSNGGANSTTTGSSAGSSSSSYPAQVTTNAGARAGVSLAGVVGIVAAVAALA
jgi:5'-nucleotidase